MPASYLPYLPDQDMLLPHSMREWLREGEAQSRGNLMNPRERRSMKLRMYPRKYPQAVAAGARTP